jgi:hypothetical protein
MTESMKDKGHEIEGIRCDNVLNTSPRRPVLIGIDGMAYARVEALHVDLVSNSNGLHVIVHFWKTQNSYLDAQRHMFHGRLPIRE